MKSQRSRGGVHAPSEGAIVGHWLTDPIRGRRLQCDQCRTRKIRCDKESPCSNCRIAQRSCSSTGLGQKPREPRQRVLISSQYEKKIDYFGARLAGIEDLLRELTISIKSGARSTTGASLPHHPAAVHRHGSASSNARTTPSSAAAGGSAFIDEGNDTDTSSDLGDSAFEGQSSLTAHTVQASEFLEHVVTRERWNNHQMSPNMQSALSSLQQIVGMQQQKKKGRMMGSVSRREVKFSNQKPVPPGGLKDLPMPPSQVVINMLRDIKGDVAPKSWTPLYLPFLTCARADNPPVTFTLVVVNLAVKDFTESCRKVFFSTEDFSLWTFIVVNCGLYYLFQEKYIMMDENSGAAAEYLQYNQMCRDNLETALANLPFFMPPKMETIEALLLGSGYAIEISRPSLAWQLNSQSCVLATSLGYHQKPNPADPLSQKKQALFWFTYMMDKGLALRFGRASILQDYDIQLPRSVPSTADMTGALQGPPEVPDPWNVIFEVWIGHAEIQGLVYEQLYSPTALQHSVEDRAESARLLVQKLAVIAAKTKRLNAAIAADERRGNGGKQTSALLTLSLLAKTDEVSHGSTAALIYRAIPPSEPGRPSMFNDKCIAVARDAFTTHQRCMETTAQSPFLNAAYLHWTILYAPFAPFIVLFCHVIETSDKEDLERLELFVDSLNISRAVSGAVDKLHRMCRIMADVAVLYVEAKDNEKKTLDANMAPLGHDFNMYLSQLGFMPPMPPGPTPGFETPGGAAGGMDSDMMNAQYQATQLGDWFEGGRNMMGLVEEDFSHFQPEPGAWSIYGQRAYSMVSKPP
ncbi:hypothetical protein GE09DRAFT_1172783 [Coniochaeta sp. 2T2.1]|nr:hypothetical protein GE09DRAFT_1172783 [Coniochaeta sp. 2T2.1]